VIATTIQNIDRQIHVSVPLNRSARALQVSGLFDVPPAVKGERSWHVRMPLAERDWQIGLIVGPSGSGKSTIARELWPEETNLELTVRYWPPEKALVDGFRGDIPVKTIVDYLCHVGLSSPPSWLKPYEVLSTGERFRADLARYLAEEDFIVYDEFTSVVDRTVAQVGSAAVAKAIRDSGKRFVAVTCHEDIEEWLQPDWVYQPALEQFTWRSLRRRPAIEVDVVRCDRQAWNLFSQHHYLSTTLNTAAICFLASWEDRPVAFSSWLSFPISSQKMYWREHRTVCLPDYQGVGIGTKVSAFCASIFAGLGATPVSTTSHPAMIASRRRSPLWQTTREMGGQFVKRKDGNLSVDRGGKSFRVKRMRSQAADVPRFTAGFRYIGPAMTRAEAKALLERE
jgi:hypothetical protein